MRIATFVRGFGLVALMAATGCKSLDITNPNDPDGERALSDPEALESFVGGASQVWFNTFVGTEGGGPLVNQAQTYTSAWNNSNMLFYGALDLDGTRNTRSWQNDPNAAARSSIEWYWEGYYRSLGLSNLVLRAIRVEGKQVNNPEDTKRAETYAELLRGLSLTGLAINYDKAYVLNENSDLGTLEFVHRTVVRDSALATYDRVIALANANNFTTPPGWANGPVYSNEEIAQIANTAAAYTIANFPRDSVEAISTDWARVVSYASNGMSSGTPVDFIINADGNAWWSDMLYWFNGIDGGRVHTRVANMLDPATQTTPYPDGGNPQPNSPDRRLGDGSFGNASMVAGFGTVPRTVNGGSDFCWSSQEIFDPARGTYLQSNICHMRYDQTGVQGPTGAYGGRGPTYMFSRHQNDLLWAEGLLRQPAGNLSTAATLINNTRVTRGGLPAASGAETRTALLQKWSYEMELEVLGLGAASYYHRRRAGGGLIVGTPREMPVPAKELGVFGLPLYTWGGTGPANSPATPTP